MRRGIRPLVFALFATVAPLISYGSASATETKDIGTAYVVEYAATETTTKSSPSTKGYDYNIPTTEEPEVEIVGKKEKEKKKEIRAKLKMKKPTCKSKKAGEILVKCKKNKNAAGYLVQYSTSKKFKNAKEIFTGSRNIKIKKLEEGKKYYVRVRAYHEKRIDALCGKWTKTMKVKVKKSKD